MFHRPVVLPSVARRLSARSFCRSAALAAAAIFACDAGRAQGQSINIPNFSFENPTANSPGFPVNVDIDNWTDTPQRAGYPGPIPWGFGTGNFPNPGVGETGHVTNMDGNRAAYILASLELGFFQELTSPQGVFIVGQAYQLTAGISPQDGTPAGTVLSLSLYYRNAGAIVPLATTPVPIFPDTNTFFDFSVSVPAVLATDAWAGQPIGILFQFTNVPAENGGYDIDNVRLQAVPEPGSMLMAGLGATLLIARRRRGAHRA